MTQKSKVKKSGQRITVLLADDHTVVRQGLRALLMAEDDLEVVGEAATGREAVQLSKKLLPDVVVMDMAMPTLNGLEAARQILRESSSTRVLMLSSYGNDEYVQQSREAGAIGYLIKQSAGDELVAAIREAKKGNPFFSPSISRRMTDNSREAFLKGQPAGTSVGQLTCRESEVLQLVAEGRTNKEIGSELKISVKTVEKHRQQVMNKLRIHDVAGLTRYAISKGMIEAQVGFVTL